METRNNNVIRIFSVMALSLLLGSSLIAQGAGPNGRGPGGPGGQRGPGGPGGPGGQMRTPRGPMLLMHPDVVKELKLSDEQMASIRELAERFRPQGGPGQGGQGGRGPGGGGQGGQRGPGGQGGPGGPGGQGGPGGPGQGNPEMGRKMDEAIKGILNQAQYRRFKQIELQASGPMGLMNPRTGQELGITEDQREAMQNILEQNRPPEPGQGDPSKFGDFIMKKLVGVLNGNQQSKWRDMIGAPFKLTPPKGGPGGPGRGPGGPGGPGGQGGPGEPPPFN